MTDKIQISARASLWRFVESLIKLVPFSKNGIETSLGINLHKDNESTNPYFDFWVSREILLNDGSIIRFNKLRIKRQGIHPGFLVVDVSGNCVTMAQVRNQYSKLKITGTPTGESLLEETSYTAELSWGELSFGFSEKNPSCLASIVFNPKG